MSGSNNISSRQSSSGQNIFIGSKYDIASMIDSSLQSQIKIERDNLVLQSDKNKDKINAFNNIEAAYSSFSSVLSSIRQDHAIPSYKADNYSSDFDVVISDSSLVSLNSSLNVTIAESDREVAFLTKGDFASPDDLIDLSLFKTFKLDTLATDNALNETITIDFLDLFESSTVSLNKMVEVLNTTGKASILANSGIIAGSPIEQDFLQAKFAVESFVDRQGGVAYGIVMRDMGTQFVNNFKYNIEQIPDAVPASGALSLSRTMDSFLLQPDKSEIKAVINGKSYYSNTGIFDSTHQEFSQDILGVDIYAKQITQNKPLIDNVHFSQDNSSIKAGMRDLEVEYNNIIQILSELTFFSQSDAEKSGVFANNSVVSSFYNDLKAFGYDLSFGGFDFNYKSRLVSFNERKFIEADNFHSYLFNSEDSNPDSDSLLKQNIIPNFANKINLSFTSGSMYLLIDSLSAKSDLLRVKLSKVGEKETKIESTLVKQFSDLNNVSYKVDHTIKIIDSLFGNKKDD